MSDFKKSNTAPQKGTAVEFSDRDDDFIPTTGFEQAPLTPQDRGSAGPGVPANTRKIR